MRRSSWVRRTLTARSGMSLSFVWLTCPQYVQMADTSTKVVYAQPMAKPRWLDKREAHLWRSWLRLNQELLSKLEEQIGREGDLSGPDYAVLVPLSAAPDGTLRARELGREILWDRSRLSHHLGRMEKRGLVAREEGA